VNSSVSKGLIAAAVVVVAAGAIVIHHFNQVETEEDAALRGESKGNKIQQCKACEEKQCGKLAAKCISQECKDVYACVQKEKCGDATEEDFSRCYCGTTEKTKCFTEDSSTPNGPCKDVMEAGARSKQHVDVGSRFYDQKEALGQAMQWANCRMSFCKECE
jgi:hypothetical protein